MLLIDAEGCLEEQCARRAPGYLAGCWSKTDCHQRIGFTCSLQNFYACSHCKANNGLSLPYLLSAVQISEEKLYLKEPFSSATAISFYICEGRLFWSPYGDCAEIGAGTSFWVLGLIWENLCASFTELCCLQKKNKKPTRNQAAIHVTNLPFPKCQGLTAITSLFLLLMSHSWEFWVN